MAKVEMDDLSLEVDVDESRGNSFVYSRHSKVTQTFHSLFLKYSSPARMCFFFTICNFLNYVDRGAFAGSLISISDEFDFTNTQAGMQGASFILGFMIFAPLFGHLSRKYRPAALMAIGLAIWCVATLATGLCFDFWSLVIARGLSGIGEASFVGLAPTYIDDIAPEKSRSKWLAFFFATIPIGAASGYGIAGIFTEYGSWRLTFILETILMVPIVLSCWFIPHSEEVMHKAGKTPKTPTIPEEQITFLRSLQMLFSNLRYVTIVLGYSAIVFVAGALYFWAPGYVNDELGLSIIKADLGIGILTVFCGLIGTAFGGWLVDYLGASDYVAASACFIFGTGSFIVAFMAFLISNVYVFFVFMTVAELMIFAITSPINILCLSVVEAENRSFSITMQIFFIHLLGDFPSPFIIGAISDHTGSLRTAMIFACLWMLYAILFFGISVIVIRAHDMHSKLVDSAA